MKAKWKILPIPQSPNPNQRLQLRSGLLVPVALTAGPGVRCERRELFGFGLQAMLATALRSRSWRAPGSASRAPRAARPSLKSSSSTHATSLYGARCYGGVRTRVSATPLARRIDSSDKTNARFSCLKATPAGFPAPSRNSGKETQFSHCVNRGSGHVDRHVCRDDCLAQRYGDVAGGGAQGPTAARPTVIAQHRAVIARRSSERELLRSIRARKIGGRSMTFAVSGASISRHGCSPMIVPREPPSDRAAVAKRPGLQSTSSQDPFEHPSALAPRLLRALRERPRRSAAEKRDERAPPQSITSSASGRN